MENKLNGKDFITIGIFTLFMLIVASVAPVLGLIPYMYLMRTPFVALLCGPIYLLYIARVQKPFAISVMGLICASIMGLLCFGSFPMFMINMICFIFAEMIARTGKYKDLRINSLSYLVLGFWTTGQDLAFWYTKDFMLEYSKQAGMDNNWLEKTLSLVTTGNLIIVLVTTFICSCLSVLFANKLLKKHFIKSGIIMVKGDR